MNNKEKIEFLEKCFNEKTGKFQILCECGRVHDLNRMMIWVINMHNLKCICGNPILSNWSKDNPKAIEEAKQRAKIRNERNNNIIKCLQIFYK